MCIYLLIKGNTAEALRAAADRGISLNQTFPNPQYPGETNGRCASAYHDAVAKWFAEEPRQAPFPTGTLLLFTQGRGSEHK